MNIDGSTLKHCRILRVNKHLMDSFRLQMVKYKIPLMSIPYFISHPNIIKGFTVLDYRYKYDNFDFLIFNLNFEVNPNFPKVEVFNIDNLSFGENIRVAQITDINPAKEYPRGFVPESSSPVVISTYPPETKFCKIARVSEILITHKYNFTLSSNNIAKIGHFLVHKELKDGYEIVKISKNSTLECYDFVVFNPKFNNPLGVLTIEELNIP